MKKYFLECCQLLLINIYNATTVNVFAQLWLWPSPALTNCLNFYQHSA